MTTARPDHVHLVRAATGSRSLSAPTGMARLSAEKVSLPPGESALIPPDSFGPERFIYVLEGTGVLSSGGNSMEVAAGDFVGAAEPLKIDNPFDAVLVYLTGGENS